MRTPHRLVSLKTRKTFAAPLLDRDETKTKRRCNLLFDFRLRIEILSSLIQERTLQRHSNLTFSGGKAFEFKFSTLSSQ